MARKPTTENEFIPPAMDYAAHEATYKGFMTLVKWSIIAIVILVVFLYIVVRP